MRMWGVHWGDLFAIGPVVAVRHFSAPVDRPIERHRMQMNMQIRLEMMSGVWQLFSLLFIWLQLQVHCRWAGRVIASTKPLKSTTYRWLIFFYLFV